MPAYRVEVQRSAERDLDRLSRILFDRISALLAALAEEPRPPGVEKVADLEAFRVRVRDYRIVYEIDDSARLVIVTRVRHRREAYRKLR